MKLVLTDGQGKSITLSSGEGDVDPVGPEALSVGTTRENQADDGIRAYAKSLRDRLNRGTQITFTVTNEWDTTAEAEAYSLDHDADVPSSGDLRMFTSKDGKPQTRLLRGCVVSSVVVKLTGVTSHTTYTIVGGAISKI